MSSKLTTYGLLLCVLYSVMLKSVIAQSTSCLTPDKVSGTCIDLRKCEPMIDLVKTLKRPHSDKIIRRLNAFQCGMQDSIKVCCPSGPIQLEPKEPNSPNVTRHKNINILPQTCGLLEPSSRFIRHHPRLNEFPWMVLLQYQTEKKDLRYLCGGTIIHKNYILTAAHCLTELKPNTKLVAIRVGEYSLKNETDCEIEIVRYGEPLVCNPPVQDLKIEEIIPHPEFGGSKGNDFNDIGLVRVSTINLELENAKPVCLPIGTEKTLLFKHAKVTGWGVSDLRTGATSDILQVIGLLVADKETCAKSYANANKSLIYSQFCAGGNSDRDSCVADSGGPLIIPVKLHDDDWEYVQQGVFSYGPEYCGASSLPGVYTLVKYYMDWILDNMRP